MNYQDYINHFQQFLQSRQGINTINKAESLKDTENTTNSVQKNESVVYENNDFKLIILKRLHKKNVRFRLQDSIFEVKIELKKPESELPKLQNLLDIFAEALVSIIESVQSFFPKTSENIAYFTIHQKPMMKGNL